MFGVNGELKGSLSSDDISVYQLSSKMGEGLDIAITDYYETGTKAINIVPSLTFNGDWPHNQPSIATFGINNLSGVGKFNQWGNAGLGAPKSTWHISGSLGTSINKHISSDSLLLTKWHNTLLVDATSGSTSIELPDACDCIGRHYTIKKIDSTSNVVFVNASSSQYIDGEATASLTAQYEIIKVQSDGSQWWKL
jgi:hypothetical protein